MIKKKACLKCATMLLAGAAMNFRLEAMNGIVPHGKTLDREHLAIVSGCLYDLEHLDEELITKFAKVNRQCWRLCYGDSSKKGNKYTDENIVQITVFIR